MAKKSMIVKQQKEHTARPKTCAQKRNQDSPERILHDIVPPCG